MALATDPSDLRTSAPAQTQAAMTRMIRRAIALAPAAAALVLAALLAGCSNFVAATPPSFVELSDQRPSYDYRALTADGVVLAIRAIDNDPKGDLAFWVEAIENRMRGTGGYALIEKRTVKCLDDHTGTQLRFGHDEGKDPHLYYLTVFVTDKRIFLLEAGGTKAQIERYDAPIEWSVTHFKPR
jgi:hypothetical protein